MCSDRANKRINNIFWFSEKREIVKTTRPKENKKKIEKKKGNPKEENENRNNGGWSQGKNKLSEFFHVKRNENVDG